MMVLNEKVSVNSSDLDTNIMNSQNIFHPGCLLLLGIFLQASTITAQPGIADSGWDDVEHVYNKQNIALQARLLEDTLLVRVYITDAVIIDQIRMCGFSVWINSEGKKKEELGITYPVGFEESELPQDPGRLEMVLSRLPPFEISQQRYKYSVTRDHEVSQGNFPSLVGLQASWRSSSEGLVLLYKIPQDLSGIILGEPIRIGFNTGVLGRPDITGRDGVGVYGTSPSNPTVVSDSGQRQRLNTYERYREFTISRSGWTRKVVFVD